MQYERFGLTPNEFSEINRIFGQYASSIDQVAVFGSRATGRHTSRSDIDLVIYGLISQQQLRKIIADFEESRIARYVDLVTYDSITNLDLKHHIDNVAQTLIAFTQEKNNTP